MALIASNAKAPSERDVKSPITSKSMYSHPFPRTGTHSTGSAFETFELKALLISKSTNSFSALSNDFRTLRHTNSIENGCHSSSK